MENNNVCFTQKEKAFSMFRWTSKRYRGITVAYIAMLIITLPLIELIALLQKDGKDYITKYTNQMIDLGPGVAGTIFAAISIIFTIILAIIAFSYMHNKRCVDLFGSLPISRSALFFSRYISVLVQTVVPLVVIGFIGAVLTLKVSIFLEIMRTVGILVLGVIGNISFIAVLSLCCGTVVDVIVSFLVINGIYPICILICNLFPVSILPGFDVDSMRWNYSLYTLFSPIFAPFAGVWGEDDVLHCIWWIVFSIILTVGCYVLCKRRKAETAQNSFIFITIEQIIKFLAGFSVGFGTGWIFALIGGNSNESYKAQYIWFFVGLCIGAFVTGIILHLIYHRGLTKIKLSLIISIIDVAAACIFAFIIISGGFGFDKRVPDVDDVMEVSVNLDDEGRYIVNGINIKENYTDNKQLIQTVLDIHKDVIQEELKAKQGTYPIVQGRNVTYAGENEEKYVANYINISYRYKDGSEMKRSYVGSFSGEKFQKLKKYVEDNSNKLNILEKVPTEEIYTVDLYNREKKYTVTLSYDVGSLEEQAKKDRLKAAIIKDYSSLGKKKYQSGKKIYSLCFICGNSAGDYMEIKCKVTKDCKNTLKILNESYKNTDLLLLEQTLTSGFYDKNPEMSGEETVYFRVPKDWDNNTEIRAVLYSRDSYEYWADNLESAMTKCEKVKGNIWKYTYLKPKSVSRYYFSSYDRIMFYQILEDKVNSTGGVNFSDAFDSQCLVLKKKRNVGLEEIDRARYQYHWEKLK